MYDEIALRRPSVRTNQRIFDAPAHMARASNSNVEVVVVWKRAARLLHDLRGPDASAHRSSDAFCKSEQSGAQRSGHEDVRYMRRFVTEHRRDKGPVLCVVEVCPRPSDGGRVSAELNEVGR